MGLITPGISPGAGGVTTAASLDAALTAARVSASSGDLYEDTSTGRVHAYLDEGPGLLVPPDLFDLSIVYADESSFGTEADSLADMAGRGWVFSQSGAGLAPSKVAGQPLILDSGGAGGVSRAVFTPDALPGDFCALILRATTDGSGVVGAKGYIGTSAHWQGYSLSAGAAGRYQWESGNAKDGIGRADADDDWVLIVFRGDSDSSVSTISALQAPEGAEATVAAIERSAVNTGSVVNFALFSSSGATLTIKECHILVKA